MDEEDVDEIVVNQAGLGKLVAKTLKRKVDDMRQSSGGAHHHHTGAAQLSPAGRSSDRGPSDEHDYIRVLGAGAFGSTFLARRKGSSKDIVQKCIPTESLADAQKKQNEGRLVKDLRHENLCQYYDVLIAAGEASCYVCIDMEFCANGRLSAQLVTVFPFICLWIYSHIHTTLHRHYHHHHLFPQSWT